MKTIRGQVQTAIERQEAVHFIYVTPKKVSIRLITPYRFKNASLFEGMDFGANDLRCFNVFQVYKLKRIHPRDADAITFQTTELKVNGKNTSHN